ncbi:histidine phosphatase family protein [Candidatus Binatia bacterium]|nr:histidine phosphatase family protein [Candidatus Binatia bacterium]
MRQPTERPDNGRARIILVRHGESEGNRDRTFTQHTNVPLTERGREQARAAGVRIRALCAPARLVASPFARARQTAEIIAGEIDCAVHFEAAFCEQSFGVFAGRPYTAMLDDAAFHEGPRWEWRPPGGESIADVYARAVPAFERLVQSSGADDVVLVSHGGVMFALWAFVAGSWEAARVAPNAGIVVVEHRAGVYEPPVLLEDDE